MHLRYIHARLRPQRHFDGIRELRHFDFLVFFVAVIFRAHGAANVMLHIATRRDPFTAQFRQTLLNIHHVVFIGVGTRRIVNRQRRFAGFLTQHDFALGNFNSHQTITARHMHFARAGQRAGGDFDGGIRSRFFCDGRSGRVHGKSRGNGSGVRYIRRYGQNH